MKLKMNARSFLIHFENMVFQLHTPPYSSCLMFELYESDKDKGHYIQMFYRNSTDEELLPLKIPKCGTKCPLEHFHRIYAHVLASDFVKECKLPSK